MIIGALLALLLEAGGELRDKLAQASGDWNALLSSSGFQSTKEKLDSIVDHIQGGDLDKAIAELQTKKAEVLNGRDASELAADEKARHAYFAVLRVESALCIKELKEAGSPQTLAQLLIGHILPALEHAAPLVLTLFV